MQRLRGAVRPEAPRPRGPGPATSRSATTSQYSTYSSATRRRSTSSGDSLFVDHPAQRGGPEHQVGSHPVVRSRPRLRLQQPAVQRRHRLVRQEDQRPDLPGPGAGLQQPVRTSSPPTSAACGTGASSSASAPRCCRAGPQQRAQLDRRFHRGPQHQRAAEHQSVRPGWGTKILVGGIAGGVGSTIQVLTPGVPINSFYVLTSTSVAATASRSTRT